MAAQKLCYRILEAWNYAVLTSWNSTGLKCEIQGMSHCTPPTARGCQGPVLQVGKRRLQGGRGLCSRSRVESELGWAEPWPPAFGLSPFQSHAATAGSVRSSPPPTMSVCSRPMERGERWGHGCWRTSFFSCPGLTPSTETTMWTLLLPCLQNPPAQPSLPFRSQHEGSLPDAQACSSQLYPLTHLSQNCPLSAGCPPATEPSPPQKSPCSPMSANAS